MENSVVFSGFGGQGGLFAGQVLAYGALAAGKNVTWFPSYGPEMRGGTAHCTVVIGDDAIGSPLVRHPHHGVVLNLPSLEKYEPLLWPGGVLVVNGSLVDRPLFRQDLREVRVPAGELAQECGNPIVANMVLLGALLASEALVPLRSVEEALNRYLADRAPSLREANLRALHRGAHFALTLTPVVAEGI